jgi:branched-chain amino acid transport system ATP-binding protein
MLAVHHLAVAYKGAPALTDVSLVVPDHGALAVLGSNGAGKTTLLRAISGILPAQKGTITGGDIAFDGESLIGRDPAWIVKRGIVHVPEGRKIFARMTVQENLRAGAVTVRSRAEAGQNRDRVLDMFPRLAERLDQQAGLLSGGEQQMLAIGRALMASPRLLLLDEPSLGLAPVMVERIGGVIREIASSGTAMVLVEQNVQLALALSNDAVVFELGKVRLAGTREELRKDRLVEQLYLGG